MSFGDEIKRMEEEIKNTEYNKHTQKHIGMLKAKLAKLKVQVEEKKASSKKSGPAYSVKKSGDATVLIVGFPSVGKSTLLNKLTNANSKVAAYDFTTLDVIPGVMEYNKAKIQVLDIPGIIEGAAGGKGLGKKVLSVVRNADLILILVDALNPEQQLSIILNELYNAGFRLNQKMPQIIISKKKSGGLNIVSPQMVKMDNETVRNILNEFGIYNSDVSISEDLSPDQMIDCLAKNRVYVPAITAINKIDVVGMEKLNEICKGMENAVLISALDGSNLDKLREAIWGNLGLMRVYMKRRGKEADMENPVIVKSSSDVKVVCGKIHKDFAKKFKAAKIWGSSKFPGQKVGLDYTLKDGDVVELC